MSLKRAPILCLLLICQLCCLSVQAVAAPPRKAAKFLYSEMGWEEDKKHSPAFMDALTVFRKDQKKGYEAFLAVAREGDLDALAMLSVTTQVAEPETYKVPAEFWENWIVTLLGEGEGTCLIAMHHLLFLLEVDDAEQAVRGLNTSSELFRRSALAGNAKGMFGASATLDRRKPVNPLPPLPSAATDWDRRALKFCSGSYCGESQYWLVASSVAGDDWAPSFLASGYLDTPEDEPEPEPAEYYLILGAMRGHRSAAVQLFNCYRKGYFGEPDYYKAITYGVLAALIKEGGKMVTDDEERFPTGATVHIWGQNWIHGLRGHPKSLTQEQYDAAVAEGTALYQQMLTLTAPARTAREQQYTLARNRLPELWVDFDKQYGER